MKQSSNEAVKPLVMNATCGYTDIINLVFVEPLTIADASSPARFCTVAILGWSAAGRMPTLSFNVLGLCSIWICPWQ